MTVPPRPSGRAGRSGRTILGWLALLLGCTGVVAGLAGIAGVWILVRAVLQPVDAAFDQFASLGTRLEQGAGTVTDRLQASRDSAGALQVRIRSSFTGALQEAGVDLRLVEGLKTEVDLLVQRLEDWVTFAELAAEAVRQFMQFADSVLRVFHAGVTAGEEVQTLLDEGRNQLGEVQKVLGEIESALDDLAREQDFEGATALFEPLFQRVDERLAALQGRSRAFSTALQHLQKEAGLLHHQMQRSVRTAGWILSFLLLWQSVAQACLARYGWVLRSARPGTGG